MGSNRVRAHIENGRFVIDEGAAIVATRVAEAVQAAETIENLIKDFPWRESLPDRDKAEALKVRLVNGIASGELDPIDQIWLAHTMLEAYKQCVADYSRTAKHFFVRMDDFLHQLSSPHANLRQLFAIWMAIPSELESTMGPKVADLVDPYLKQSSAVFEDGLQRQLDYEIAVRDAQQARHPLDHKKFMDMLVDDMEDKYIELLEGTRAHTANIDAYIKRLSTALDDDFNTQFYYPAFRHVRTASRMYDVNLSQVETTRSWPIIGGLRKSNRKRPWNSTCRSATF